MHLYIYILIAFILLGIIYQRVEPVIKGSAGERRVASILSGLPEAEYRVLNNVMLLTHTGTTQIDHIVVSIYGIFVIETKNYNGWITGGERSGQWTKNMYGKKYRFYNPLKQNYGHIKALRAMLNLPESIYVSIVAFSSNATIKVETKEHVVYFSELESTIRQYRTPVIKADQLDVLVSVISNANIDSRENRMTHVENIRRNVEVSNNKVSRGVCPRCGEKLVLRRGKYGSFVGCSNYPKCRFTK